MRIFELVGNQTGTTCLTQKKKHTHTQYTTEIYKMVWIYNRVVFSGWSCGHFQSWCWVVSLIAECLSMDIWMKDFFSSSVHIVDDNTSRSPCHLQPFWMEETHFG